MSSHDVGRLDLGDDHVLALRVVTEVGRVLNRVRQACVVPRRSWRPLLRSIVGDQSAQAVIARVLAEARPDDAVRSEEARREDPRRQGARRVWIVDPLDGTAEFATADRTDWATQVALWADGELVAGAVALPAKGRMYWTGGFRTGVSGQRSLPGAQAVDRRPRLAVSRSRPPTWIGAVAERLGAEVVPMGSAGAKTAAVLDGEVDAYLHDGGQYEWDSAGPVAVAHAAGLHASRIDGSHLAYNQDDPWLPDLVICRPDLAARLLIAVGEFRVS